MDQTAEACDACTRVVCIDCWDRDYQRCTPCTDGLFVDDEKVVDALSRRPGQIADDLWRVLRWAWLAAHPGKKGPAPRWWADKVAEEIQGLRRIGIVECSHGDRCVYQRATDLGPLCEWRVVPKYRQVAS